jgi:hypothetical protein
MNLFMFTRQPPTSRHPMSDSIIVGVGITEELAEHWAQGYHRDMDASSRDFQTSVGTKNPTTF